MSVSIRESRHARARDRTWVAAQLWRFPKRERFSTQISDHRATLCTLCSGFFATNRPYVRVVVAISGPRGWPCRCVSSQLTARRAAR